MNKEWIWGIRTHDGVYVMVEADTVEEAVKLLGWDMSRVKRFLPLINREEFRKRQMRVETKELLRRFQGERRALERGGERIRSLAARSPGQGEGCTEEE